VTVSGVVLASVTGSRVTVKSALAPVLNVTAPLTVPIPPFVAPELTVIRPVPLLVPLINKQPALTVVVPT